MAVKTDADQVKIAVITTQNKIVTEALDNSKPKEENNLMIDADINIEAESSAEIKSKLLARQRQHSKRFNAHSEHVASDETDKAISFINNQNLGWKADTCKLQKHHSEYGSHCDKVNLAQVSDDKNQTLVQTKVFGENTDNFKKALTTAQKWIKKYKKADDIPDSEVPESYNFADIDGYNFLGPVRD